MWHQSTFQSRWLHKFVLKYDHIRSSEIFLALTMRNCQCCEKDKLLIFFSYLVLVFVQIRCQGNVIWNGHGNFVSIVSPFPLHSLVQCLLFWRGGGWQGEELKGRGAAGKKAGHGCIFKGHGSHFASALSDEWHANK